MKRRRCVPESGRLSKGQNGVDGYRGVLYDSGGRQQRRALGGESIEIRGGKADAIVHASFRVRYGVGGRGSNHVGGDAPAG
jgi:hypothetical protein